MAAKRLAREFADFFASKEAEGGRLALTLSKDGDFLSEWTIKFYFPSLLPASAAPGGGMPSPLAGRYIALQLQPPSDYPFKPPRARLSMAPDMACGTYRLLRALTVGQDILYDQWSPALTILKLCRPLVDAMEGGLLASRNAADISLYALLAAGDLPAPVPPAAEPAAEEEGGGTPCTSQGGGSGSAPAQAAAEAAAAAAAQAAAAAAAMAQARAASPGLRIFVKTLTGKTLSVDAYEADTVADIKFVIQGREGIDPGQQRLVFRGKQLEDDRTLGDYSIANDDAVQLVLRAWRLVAVAARPGKDLTRPQAPPSLPPPLCRPPRIRVHHAVPGVLFLRADLASCAGRAGAGPGGLYQRTGQVCRSLPCHCSRKWQMSRCRAWPCAGVKCIVLFNQIDPQRPTWIAPVPGWPQAGHTGEF